MLKKLMKLEPDTPVGNSSSKTGSSYISATNTAGDPTVKVKRKKLKAKARANNRLRKLNPQLDMNQPNMIERHIQSAEKKLFAGKGD